MNRQSVMWVPNRIVRMKWMGCYAKTIDKTLMNYRYLVSVVLDRVIVVRFSLHIIEKPYHEPMYGNIYEILMWQVNFRWIRVKSPFNLGCTVPLTAIAILAIKVSTSQPWIRCSQTARKNPCVHKCVKNQEGTTSIYLKSKIRLNIKIRWTHPLKCAQKSHPQPCFSQLTRHVPDDVKRH